MFPVTVVGRDKTLPRATIAIIVLNILVFLWELSIDAQGEGFLRAALQNYGLEGLQNRDQSLGTTSLDAFRSLFLHAESRACLGNMWFLYLFADWLNATSAASIHRRLRFTRCLGDNRPRRLWQYGLHVTDTGVVIGASGAVAA